MSDENEFEKLATLPPEEAIAYMKARGITAETYHYTDLWQSQHDRAFTISRLTRADLLERIQESLIQSVAGDMTRNDWLVQTRALLQKEGLWGNVEVTDPNTGEQLSTTFNEARLRLIFDTNVRQALAAGQWQSLLRTKARNPYVRYIAMDDDRTRPEHRAWHNVVLPIDDPWWDTHRPPNGYHCRCRVVGISKVKFRRGYSESRPGAEDDEDAPLVREAFKTERPPEQLVEWRNPATGVVQKIPKGIDPGFDYNAGTTEGSGTALEDLVRNKLAKLSPEVRAAAERDGIDPPPSPSR